MGYNTHGLKYLSLSPIRIRPEYAVWSSMKARCLNPNSQQYKNYGERGIKVCERWMLFENFFADMGERPSSKHSLGRLENDGNYDPSNCAWQTKQEQDNNKRTNVFLEFNGVKLTVAQWAKRIGLNTDTLWMRINAGWSVEKALTKTNRNSNAQCVNFELAESMLKEGKTVAEVARYFKVRDKVITPIRQSLGILPHRNQYR